MVDGRRSERGIGGVVLVDERVGIRVFFEYDFVFGHETPKERRSLAFSSGDDLGGVGLF